MCCIQRGDGSRCVTACRQHSTPMNRQHRLIKATPAVVATCPANCSEPNARSPKPATCSASARSQEVWAEYVALGTLMVRQCGAQVRQGIR